MELPVSLIPKTRAFFENTVGDLSDEEIIGAFVTENNIGPDVEIDEIVRQMEDVAQERITTLNKDSVLKNTRAVKGLGAASLDDNQLVASYAKARNLSLDTPFEEVVNMMEEESRVERYQADIAIGGDTVFAQGRLPESVDFVRQSIGFTPLMQEGIVGQGKGGPIDFDEIEEFLAPKEGRRGLLGKLGKAASGLFVPQLIEGVQRAGQTLSALGSERQKYFNQVENRFNDPELLSSFAGHVERFKQKPRTIQRRRSP